MALAFLLRLNRAAVFAGTLVWQPFTMPFIVAAEVAIGRSLLGGGGEDLTSRWILPGAVGALVLGATSGAVVGAIVWAVRRRLDRQTGASDVKPDGGTP